MRWASVLAGSTGKCEDTYDADGSESKSIL